MRRSTAASSRSIQRPPQRDDRPARAGPASNLLGLLVRGRRRGRLQHARRPGRPVRRSTRTASKVRIDLPIANATVKEKRGEVYVNVGKTLSPALRIDGGVNYEFSNLKVRGDATADRTLKFLKPNLTLDWKPGGGWHTQFSVRRTVAQLDFYDFISVGDLSTKRVSGGNADLEPQRAWEFRATRRASAARRRPVQARSRPRSGQQAPGPHPDLRRATGNGVRRAGQPRHRQALFRDADARRAARHAVEGPPRQVHRHAPADAGRGSDQPRAAQVQRLLPRLAVGARRPPRSRAPSPTASTLSDNQRFTFYRTDEFDTNFNRGAYVTAFVEYRPEPAHRDHTSTSTMRSARMRRATGILFRPNRAEPESSVRRISRPQPPPQLPDHAEAELRRRDRHEGGGEGQMSRGVARLQRRR